MNEFNEPPSNQGAQEQLQNLLDAARKMRDAKVFNNPMFPDILKTPEFAEYIEETYLMDRDRWN